MTESPLSLPAPEPRAYEISVHALCFSDGQCFSPDDPEVGSRMRGPDELIRLQEANEASYRQLSEVANETGYDSSLLLTNCSNGTNGSNCTNNTNITAPWYNATEFWNNSLCVTIEFSFTATTVNSTPYGLYGRVWKGRADSSPFHFSLYFQ